MTYPTPVRKPAQKSRVAKAHAPKCAVCGTGLKRPGAVVHGIGVVGPECAKNVQAALADLSEGPLALLIAQGEIKLVLQPTADGGWVPPQDALGQYCVWADRAGVELGGFIKDGFYRLSLKPRSLQGYAPAEAGVKGVEA